MRAPVEAAVRQEASALMESVYADLRRLAERLMRSESSAHTLQPTAVVHEAYMRLCALHSIRWRGRAHFFTAAAQLVRRVLVDHARRRRALKRGGGTAADPLDFDPPVCDEVAQPEQVLDLDLALVELSRLNPAQARLVELRCFAGLSHAEIADVLGIPLRRASDDWAMARAWLARRLRGGGHP